MITAESFAFPEYEVISLLAQGGMGSVYLATDRMLNRKVAIKTISDRCRDKVAVARFEREARTMARMQHPNVVQIYSFHRHSEKTYIVMEYIDGENLSERIKWNGRLSASEAFKVLGSVAAALKAAWEMRIVHRDVKPSNILLDGNGRIYLSDFGLAKPVDEDSKLTISELFVGTPHYISPEQAQGCKIDLRSDIYSLGIVLYEMLTGEPPFQATTPVAIVAQHLYTPLPELQRKYPDLPVEAVQLVEWMTQKSPEERPCSYEALLEAISGSLLTSQFKSDATDTTRSRFSSSAETLSI